MIVVKVEDSVLTNYDNMNIEKIRLIFSTPKTGTYHYIRRDIDDVFRNREDKK